MPAITFVLNDETVVNVYGFRVKNAALNLERFRANPVMLAHHVDGISTVCGRWENIRVEGVLLKADAVFDMEDEDAAKIAGKVNRGFLKGCSLGFMANDFATGRDGIPDLSAGEVLEASVCPIPGNSGALKLYAPNGTVLSASEIKLSVDTLSSGSHKKATKPQPLNMEFLAKVITLLGLPESATDMDALAELETLVESKDATAKELIDEAISEGKLTEADRTEFTTLAVQNLAVARKTIARIAPRKRLLTVTNKGDDNAAADGARANRENWTLDDWRKKAPNHLAANPTFYKDLVKKEFGG